MVEVLVAVKSGFGDLQSHRLQRADVAERSRQIQVVRTRPNSELIDVRQSQMQ